MINAPSLKITKIVKDNFLNIFDEKIGLVTEIVQFENVLKTTLFNYYVSAKSKEGCILYSGSGTAQSRDTALSKAIGECLERYCLSSYDYKPFIQTTCNSLTNRYPCVDPHQVEIYTQDELNHLSFNQYNDSFETFFCVGYNVTKTRHQYIPIPLVYLYSSFFERYTQKLNIIQQTISTGAAFGVDFYQTALAGLYEVIERDAMMAFWLLGQQAPLIQISTLNLQQKTLVEEIEKNEISVYLFDISLSDAPFVILSCLKSENSLMPSAVFSAAAHHDIDMAIQKTLEEVVSAFELGELLLRKNRTLYKNFLDPENWDKQVGMKNDHVRFWSHYEIFYQFGSKLDFIFNNINSVSRDELKIKRQLFSDTKSIFFYIVDLLGKNGYDTLIVDISSPDMSSLGFMTLKVIIPGYLPLYLGHKFTYRRPKRLIEIAKSIYCLNFDDIDLNTTPHPFP